MKRPRGQRSDLFESLHDDLVTYILCKLSSTASSPPDFIAVLLTCKRLNKLGLNPLVLSNSCSKVLAVRAKAWCDEVHMFLKLCVNTGNQEAYYTLGMNRRIGASLLAKAAIKSHASSLYSLALIQFNGSGGWWWSEAVVVVGGGGGVEEDEDELIFLINGKTDPSTI